MRRWLVFPALMAAALGAQSSGAQEVTFVIDATQQVIQCVARSGAFSGSELGAVSMPQHEAQS